MPDEQYMQTSVAEAVAAIEIALAAANEAHGEDELDRCLDLEAAAYLKLSDTASLTFKDVIAKLGVLRRELIGQHPDGENAPAGDLADIRLLESSIDDLRRLTDGGLLSEIAAP